MFPQVMSSYSSYSNEKNGERLRDVNDFEVSTILTKIFFSVIRGYLTW